MEHHLNVSGMTCGHCEKAVRSAVEKVDPNAKIVINRQQGKLDVESDQPREALEKAIKDEGYTVSP